MLYNFPTKELEKMVEELEQLLEGHSEKDFKYFSMRRKLDVINKELEYRRFNIH
jgi:hypothetical protein